MTEIVSNADIKASVDKLDRRVELLDGTIRGNNGEGVVAKLARIHEQTQHNVASIGRAFDRFAELERKHEAAIANIRDEHAEAIRNIRDEHTAARSSTTLWLQTLDRRMAGLSAKWAMGGALGGVFLGAVAKVLFERWL